MELSSASSNYRILVTPRGFPVVGLEILRGNANFQVEMFDSNSGEDLARRAIGVDALLCSAFDRINENVIETAGPQLKVVSSYSVGVDHIDKEALRKRKIRLSNVGNICSDSCADLIASFTISVLRRSFEAADAVKTGNWPKMQEMVWMAGRSPRACTFGIIGFGNIGRAVAMRIKAFRPRALVYFDPWAISKVDKETGAIGIETFDEFLTACDVLIICCSFTESTRNLLSKEKMKLMKRGSYLINASRGPVIDQDGLVELLQEGHFGGVGLDVTAPEPLPSTHALLKFPQVTVLPHIASAEIETREEMAILAANNVIAALEGRKMPCEVFL